MQAINIDQALWIASDLLELGLVLLLFALKRARRFPLFTFYVASNFAEDVILYFVNWRGSRAAYFDVYWALKVVEVAAQFGALYEVAGIVFRPMGVWAPDIRKRFALLASGSLVVAAALTGLASPPTDRFIQAVLIKGSFFVACLMSELFVVTTTLSTRIGLAWRNHVSAISQGLGVYSIITVIVEGTNSYLGAQGGAAGYTALERVRVTTYFFCICYWIVSLYRDEPVRREITAEMRAKLFTLQRDLTYDLGQIRSRDNKN